MTDPQHLLALDALFGVFLGFVALAVTTEAMIGFGSVLLALTLGANLYPISILLPLLVCMNVMLTSYIVFRHHEHVAWDVLLRQILPAMGIGVVVGYALFVYTPDALMKTLLGIFVLAVATIELRRMLRPAGAPVRAVSNLRFATTSLAAGIVHGMTASGGPVLVYALNRQGLDKSAFRSTLACVWLVLNGALILVYGASGRLGAHNAWYVAALVPVIVVSVALGEWLHFRLDERSFRVLVLIMLLLAGIALVM